MTRSLLPWTLLVVAAAGLIVLEIVVCRWKKRAEYWMAKANEYEGRAVRAEGRSSGIDPRIANMPDAKASDFPRDLLIGSVANPLKLIREDARLNDTARAGYVEDFAPVVLP